MTASRDPALSRRLVAEIGMEPCTTCPPGADGTAHLALAGTTCPRSVRCPNCGSTASRCRRPSGHDADGLHVERAVAAERLDLERDPDRYGRLYRLWPEHDDRPPTPTLFDVAQ